MKIKSCISMLSLGMIALTNCLQADSTPVMTYKIAPVTADKTWTEGLIQPINRQKLSCYNKGSVILDILPVGSEFKGEIVDTKGIVIQKGTTIVSIDKKRFINELKIAQETLSAKKAKVNQTKSELTRSKKLILKNAVSLQKHEAATANYKTAIANYISAKSTLDSAKIALKHCDIKAPFNGIVTKHLWSVGSTRGDGDDIVEVMNIDYLFVSIDDASTNLSNFFDDSMVYKTYSKHSDEYTLAFNPKIQLNNKMYLIVENHKIPRVFPLKSQEKLPIIRHIYLTMEYGGKLWVPSDSVNKDQEGTYVYTCRHNTGTKLANSHEWILNKLYLDINEEFIYSSVLANMTLVNNPPKTLEAGTMVLCDKGPSYKDGTVAFLQPLIYKFYPNQKVFINIPDTMNNNDCFFVPKTALNTNTNSLFKIENNTAKKINVDIIRSVGMYYEVKSDELITSDLIALPKGSKIEDNAKLLIIKKWTKSEDKD